MDTKLNVLAELFVEFFEIFSVLNDRLEEFNTFFGDVFLDDF
jgi:hypothetical protein